MTDERRQDGFELNGTFYRWHVSDTGKDLMLIDRFTGMGIPEFFALIDDDDGRTRAPVLLAMIATSIRAHHPDWSVERITRLVQNTGLSEIEFVGADAEEDTRPPANAAATPPDTSRSTANGSSLSSTPQDSSTSPTLSATPR